MPRFRFGSFFAIRAGSCDGGGATSNSRSAVGVPVCSCCWTESWLTVSFTVILSTYALRTGSVDAFQAGLREYAIDLVGTHLSTLYGPSDGKLLPSSVLAGRYLSDSTGAGEKAGRVSMPTKYVAGWVR